MLRSFSARPFAPLLLMIAGVTASGCFASRSDEAVQDGVAALAHCDVRTAHRAFASGFRADRSHAQSALGFALTDLALLPEDPAVEAMLADIGFSGGVDMQSLVFGDDGVLAMAARGDECDAIQSYAEEHVPYAPLGDDDIDPATLLRDDLTVGDLLAHAQGLEPRLAELSQALEVAAGGITEPVAIDGGCGLGQLTLQAPELYAAAALIESIRAALAMSRAYDWSIPVAVLIQDDPDAVAAVLNGHLGRVVEPTQAAAARAHLHHGASLGLRAIEQARAISGPVEHGLFDWSEVPDAMLDDANRLLTSLEAALDGPSEIADVTPTLTVDLSRLFTDPIDLTALGGPLFSVEEDEWGDRYVTVNGELLNPALEGIMTPAPWDEGVPEPEWTPADRFDNFDVDPVVEPAMRYQDTFECAGDTSGEPTPVPSPDTAPIEPPAP